VRPLRFSINVTLDGCCDHRALVELGLSGEYEFVVHPRLAGHGPTLFAGLSERVDLRLVGRQEFGSGAVALRYEPAAS
jgi:dihydrofolate reductase